MFVFWEKKGVSVSTFKVVVVVDWYIHKVAVVEAERAPLFYFCSVGQYRIYRSLLAILSRMKKYLHFMCFVCLELDVGPLTSSHMVDWLSLKRMFCLMEYPCASMKYRVWRIEGRI